jgi:SET and MYND domain-containing protein
MVSHPTMASEEWKKSLNLAAIDIFDELPLAISSTTSINEIINLALKINANSFALYSPKRNTEHPIGIGIYPFAALCNHSCAPNVHYTTSVGGSMQFIALQDIEEGDELFANDKAFYMYLYKMQRFDSF